MTGVLGVPGFLGVRVSGCPMKRSMGVLMHLMMGLMLSPLYPGQTSAASESPHAAQPLQVQTSPPASEEIELRTGQLGLGLGLEFPLAGVMTGRVRPGELGWGYTLGAALSWEVTPRWLTRVYVLGGETYAGSVGLQYLESGARAQSQQAAEWFSLEVGVGGAYLFRNAAKHWVPFVGADIGWAYRGYDFHFDEQLSKVETVDLATTFATGHHEAIGWGPSAGLRAGLRFDILRWLASQVELSCVYLPVTAEVISNTKQAREVLSHTSNVLLVRATYAVRLGL